MKDSGSDTVNGSVVFLSTCEEGKVKENEIQERSRNTGHSREFNVIDEGYFLLRVIWSKFSTYKEIIQKFINYVQSRYGICVVVLMGIEMAHQSKIMNIVEG